MPCPYAGAGDSRETVDRQDFLRSTLVIGGGDALQATLMRYGPPEHDPTGTPPATGGQYDWGGTEEADADNEHADADADGCPVDHDETEADADDEYDDFDSDWPAYHVVYRLTHRGETPAEDRRRLVDGLRSMTDQIGWGGDGVAWAVGYAPRFLEDGDASVPAPMRTAPPTESVAPDGGRTAGGDCLLHLASDEPRALLVAEAALWGETDDLGVDVSVSDPVGDAFPRPASAPGRRVAMSPHGVDAPAVGGDAVVELSAFEATGGDTDPTPVDDHDRDQDHGTDGGDAAGCPVDHDEEQKAGDADDAVDLRHLNPASPGVLRVALCSLDESPLEAERYYVPPAGDRTLAGE